MREILPIEREMVQNPGSWPRWPVLPMKLRNGDFNNPDFCGLLVDLNSIGVDDPVLEPPFKIYLANLLMIGNLAGARTKEYPTLDELLAEWAVD